MPLSLLTAKHLAKYTSPFTNHPAGGINYLSPSVTVKQRLTEDLYNYSCIIYDHLYSQWKAVIQETKRTKPLIAAAPAIRYLQIQVTVYWLCFLRCRLWNWNWMLLNCKQTFAPVHDQCVSSVRSHLSVCLSVCGGRTVTVLIALVMNLQAGRWHFGRVSKRLRFCGFPPEMKSRFTPYYFEMSRNLWAIIEPFRFDERIS